MQDIKNRRIKVIGDLGVGGERGRVIWGGIATALTGTDYKDPQKVIKKYEKGNSDTRCDREYSQAE